MGLHEAHFEIYYDSWASQSRENQIGNYIFNIKFHKLQKATLIAILWVLNGSYMFSEMPSLQMSP